MIAQMRTKQKLYTLSHYHTHTMMRKCVPHTHTHTTYHTFLLLPMIFYANAYTKQKLYSLYSYSLTVTHMR